MSQRISSPGLTFNGSHSSDFDLLMLTQSFPVLPELKKIEIKVPGRNSVIDYSDGTMQEMEFRLLFQEIAQKLKTTRTIQSLFGLMGAMHQMPKNQVANELP